jgi:hypothetical protein
MGNSFFNEIKPVGDTSWMAALGQQRQQQQDLVKMGEEFSRSDVPSVAAQGRQMMRNGGYDIAEPGQAQPFNAGPDYQQGVQAQAAQPGMASPALGQVGGNEAQYYQNQGASNYDAQLKAGGINLTKDKDGWSKDIQDASGNYMRWNPVTKKHDIPMNDQVAQMFGGLGTVVSNTPEGYSPADVARQDAAREMTYAVDRQAPVQSNTYQDSIAKGMGLPRGTADMEQAIQGQMAKRDNQSAQQLSDQAAQKKFAGEDLLTKIRNHAFSSTTSTAVAASNGINLIDQLEAQQKITPEKALELKDNFILSFHNEQTTGTHGITKEGLGYKGKRPAYTGPAGGGKRIPLTYKDAAGNLQQGNFAIPESYAGDWRRYSNIKTDDFIYDASKSFGLDSESVKVLKEYAKKNENLSDFFENVPQNAPEKLKRAAGLLVKMGTTGNAPMYNTFDATGQAAYDEVMKKAPPGQEAMYEQQAKEAAYAAQGNKKANTSSGGSTPKDISALFQKPK